MEHHHTTPFEMVEFKFRVHCPVVTAWQWVRHRTWSYNFSSGRYTEFDGDSFYMPDEWRAQANHNKQMSEGRLEKRLSDSLDFLLEGHIRESMKLYEIALDMGVAREQARLFLPAWASYYTFVAKVDAHNLMHFLKLRMAPEAQHEIRVYAEAIYDHFFKPVLPWTAEAFETFRS
jgi:thymidylate synthase (FAD)